jgi:undecaprenyl-diphosphatase
VALGLLQIIILGLVQGAAELLPVSSSAHVIVAEKLMGLDPVSPEMTFLLVMLHTGTMFAVIAYFWRRWREHYFRGSDSFWAVARPGIVATLATGLLGLGLKHVIERHFLGTAANPGEVEQLFGRLPLIAASLAVAGVLIVVAGTRAPAASEAKPIGLVDAILIGLVQGLILPFRGFSRSGGTISTGLLRGLGRRRTEEFSFALAVVLTPAFIAQELLRLLKLHAGETERPHLAPLLAPGLAGMACSFLAGLLALRLLSRWLEHGRWQYFGYYCLAAAALVFALAKAGL